MLRALTAIVCSGTLIGCGASWPERAHGLAAPAVHSVTTVDVLPVDLEVWTEHGYPVEPEEVRSDASNVLMANAVQTIQQRAYAIDGLIDWNGEIEGRGAVMDQGDLERTIATLARYDLVTGPITQRLPDPQLPAKLGTVSGADATLYIGGWAYVAAHHESTGEKVAEGVLIGLAVVAVVAIVAIAVAGAGKGSHGGSHGGGSHGGGGGHAVAGHSGPVFHDHRGGAAEGNPQFATVLVRDHRVGEWQGGAHATGDHHFHDGGGHSLHVDTAIDVIDSIDVHPDWSSAAPQSGEDSQMYVEMTLVDNATGTVLWHAHQKFPANAASKEDLARVTRTMLASLPAH